MILFPAVPWIMFTKTALLMQTNWNQFFHPILKEGSGGHYFKLKNDMSNLISIIDYLRNNPETYEKMTNRAYNFAQKNLTSEAITTYYKTMLTKIAERFI
jgi:1,4-alpha-glucan branching enzyme